MAEITAYALRFAFPLTWTEFVQGCTELQEMAQAGWMVWVDGVVAQEVAEASQAASGGSGPVPAHVPGVGPA